MIEAINLSKRFGEIEAVRDVTFKLEGNQVVGLLGPNGAGKTTTMRMLTTFIPPSGGTATIAGFDINKEAERVRQVLGYLPEVPPLYPELKVKEYLVFVGKLRGLKGALLKSRIDEMLDKCGLVNVHNRVCSELSKGYRQRVGLAQALIHKPQVIILDEPTSGLDPAQIIEIRKLIKDLATEHTVVLSTHILQEVMETCSRVLIIAKGSIVVEGSVQELTAEKTLEQHFIEAVSREV